MPSTARSRPTLRMLPRHFTLRIEPTLPVLRIEPTLAKLRIEPTLAMLRIEPTLAAQSRQPIESALRRLRKLHQFCDDEEVGRGMRMTLGEVVDTGERRAGHAMGTKHGCSERRYGLRKRLFATA